MEYRCEVKAMTLEEEIEACREHGVGEAARMLSGSIISLMWRLVKLGCPEHIKIESLVHIRDEATKRLAEMAVGGIR